LTQVGPALGFLLQATIHGACNVGNKFQLVSTRAGRMAKQTKHICYLIKAFTLQCEVHLWISVAGGGLNIAPEKVTKLVHYASQVLYQPFI